MCMCARGDMSPSWMDWPSNERGTEFEEGVDINEEWEGCLPSR